MIPVSLSILRESFPPKQQAMAMAVYGMGVVVAPAVGPVLGGWLTDAYGWPWIFYVNVPVSIPAMLMAMAFIEDPAYLRRGIARIDWVGIGLLGIGLTAMQIVLERGQQDNWFSSNWIVLGTVVAVVSLLAMILWELHVKEPVVNVRLIRNLPLAAGSGIGFVFGVALFGTTFIIPQFTQQVLGYPAYQSGMVLLPRAISLFVLMPVAGWMLRYVDGRLMVTAGLMTLGVSYYLLGQLSLTVGFWNFVPILLVLGAGMPFIFVTLTTVSLSTIAPEDSTDASSIYTLARTIGGNVGYALMATLIADYTQIHRTHLVNNVSRLNPSFLALHQGATADLIRQGFTTPDASQRAYALVNQMVNQQAEMMAYNTSSLWMGILLLLCVPMVFMLPGRGHHETGRGGAMLEG